MECVCTKAQLARPTVTAVLLEPTGYYPECRPLAPTDLYLSQPLGGESSICQFFLPCRCTCRKTNIALAITTYDYVESRLARETRGLACCISRLICIDCVEGANNYKRRLDFYLPRGRQFHCLCPRLVGENIGSEFRLRGCYLACYKGTWRCIAWHVRY